MIFGLALTKHVAGFFDVMLALKQYDADVYVTGHVGRTGTVADLDNQIAVFEDIRDGAQKGLKEANVNAIAGTSGIMDPKSNLRGNSWLMMKEFLATALDICADHVLNHGKKDWKNVLAASQVAMRSHCYEVQNQIRIAEDYVPPSKGTTDQSLSVFPSCDSAPAPCTMKQADGSLCVTYDAPAETTTQPPPASDAVFPSSSVSPPSEISSANELQTPVALLLLSAQFFCLCL